jgi:PAT family beta-lactamase induction signal transducer AmpG
MLTTGKNRPPALWISILYFAEGFPYTVVNLMSVIFLKDVGANNELIGLTSFFYLPWVLKGFWGLAVDLYSTKRAWILTTELLCTGLFLLLAFSVQMPHLAISIIIFAAIALVSATHDIAVDGFYLSVLNKEQQALYVGVQTTAYKLAWLVGNGGLVFFAGYFANQYIVGKTATNIKIYKDIHFSVLGSDFNFHPLKLGWTLAFIIAGIIFLLIYLFQLWYLPSPESQQLQNKETDERQFIHVFKTYFAQYRIAWIVTYILTFRLGDAFMLKMAPPFLMDKVEKGGLGISTAEVGFLYGVVGVFFLLIGGIIGGYLIAKQGLKKWLWPTAILQNSAILMYWILAVYRPSIIWVYVVNGFEQLSYGIGVSAYTVFLMGTVSPEYKASHYAITTALMSTGIFIPGLLSGYLQTWIGYDYYFLMSLLVTIPGLITILFLPLEDKN